MWLSDKELMIMIIWFKSDNAIDYNQYKSYYITAFHQRKNFHL